MARLPALILAYTKLDGRDYPTIKNIARTIREAGFIPTTKRGSGASAMSESEVVNLILGANGAESAVEAPEAVERLRKLFMHPDDLPGDEIVEGDDQTTHDLRRRRVRELYRGFTGSERPLLFANNKRIPPESKAAETQRLLGQAVWGGLVSINNLGEACEWLVCNAGSIDAEITKLWTARTVADLKKKPGLYPDDEDRAAIARGCLPDGMEDYATWWREAAIDIKLTIGRYEALFEALSRTEWGFPNIRLRYDGADDQPKPHRRAFVEIDFHIIRELSRLVAPKPRRPIASSPTRRLARISATPGAAAEVEENPE